MKFLFNIDTDPTRLYCAKCLPSCELDHIYNCKLNLCPCCSNEIDDVEPRYIFNMIFTSRQTAHLLTRLFTSKTYVGITASSLLNTLTSDAINALLSLLIEDLNYNVFGYAEKSPNVFVRQEKDLFSVVHVTPLHITYVFTKKGNTVSNRLTYSEQRLFEVFSLNSAY